MLSNCQKWAFIATIAWKRHNKKRALKKSDEGLGLHQVRELAEGEGNPGIIEEGGDEYQL